MGFGTGLSIDLDVIRNAPTWEDGLRAYKASKLKKVETVKPKPVTTYEKTREEVEYHPIRQTFADTKREKRVKKAEASRLHQSLNKAWDNQMKREQHFNIISQAPKRSHAHEVPYVQKLKPPSLVTATREQYNLLSTLSFEDHHWAPPGRRPPGPPKPAPPKPKLAHARPKSFDVISNKYKRDHSARVAKETAATREKIVKNYWSTHDFDPVRCAFYDDEKESYYQRRVHELLMAQGGNQLSKLPPSYANRDGVLYDIATGVVKDPVRLLEKEEKARAKLAANAARLSFDEVLKEKREREDDLVRTRANNRISDHRFSHETSRGFNIINNRGFAEHGSPPAPHTRARANLWSHMSPGGGTRPSTVGDRPF